MATRNNPFRPIIQKLPAPFRNKYFVVLGLFFAWLIFFDKHDVLTQWKLQQTLQTLEEDKVFYEESIEQLREDQVDLENNQEKFAREHYQMSKKDEDVFIIIEK